MDADLLNLLQNLGLTEKEARLYVAIQKHGRVTPTELAHTSGINRTTVYSVTKSLLSKGIIIEDLGSPKHELLATAPEELARLLDAEQERLHKKQTAIEEAVEAIRSVAREAAYPVPKIQFVKEDRMEAFLYDRAPVWDKNLIARNAEYLGFQEPAFVERFEKWIDWYWSRASDKIRLRLLSATDTEAETRVSQKNYSNRKIIFWKPGLHFTATMWVMGDYVVMFALSSSPNYLVEIHDARFAENQRALFTAILDDIAHT